MSAPAPADARSKWGYVVSHLPSFKWLSAATTVTQGNVTATGSRVVLDHPSERDVQVAVETAAGYGLDVAQRQRGEGRVFVEVIGG